MKSKSLVLSLFNHTFIVNDVQPHKDGGYDTDEAIKMIYLHIKYSDAFDQDVHTLSIFTTNVQQYCSCLSEISIDGDVLRGNCLGSYVYSNIHKEVIYLSINDFNIPNLNRISPSINTNNDNPFIQMINDSEGEFVRVSEIQKLFAS